jgi:hypothetical protein
MAVADGDEQRKNNGALAASACWLSIMTDFKSTLCSLADFTRSSGKFGCQFEFEIVR